MDRLSPHLARLSDQSLAIDTVAIKTPFSVFSLAHVFVLILCFPLGCDNLSFRFSLDEHPKT